MTKQVNTSTAEAAEAELARLRSERAARLSARTSAIEAWKRDRTPANWQLAEDLERQAKQIDVDIPDAEKRLADARAADAQRKLEAKRVEVRKEAARLRAEADLPSKKAEEIAAIALLLARHYTETSDHVDRRRHDLQALARLANEAGVSMPDVGESPSMPMILAGIRNRVRNALFHAGVHARVAREVPDLVTGEGLIRPESVAAEQ